LFARPLLEVLYAPIKAFKEITEKPDFKAPLLILVLVLCATAGTQYITASRLYLEDRTPANDEWTESTEPTSLWVSNGDILVSDDRVVGNCSIQSAVLNETQISLTLADIGPLDLSREAGFEGLSFRIKWTHENMVSPSSDATLRLLSGTESRYFMSHITSDLSESSNAWANLTVRTGYEENWDPVNLPSWGNITGLQFLLSWSDTDSGNLNLTLDDVYFFKYVSFVNTEYVGTLIVSSLLDATIVFFLNWVVYAAVLLVTVKLFQEQTGPWKPFFTVVGYIFSVSVIYVLVNAILFAVLPELRLPAQTWPPTAEEFSAVQALVQERWEPTLTYNFGLILPYIIDGWIGLLLAVVVHSLCKTTWKKAVAIAVVASVLGFFMRTLLI